MIGRAENSSELITITTGKHLADIELQKGTIYNVYTHIIYILYTVI